MINKMKTLLPEPSQTPLPLSAAADAAAAATSLGTHELNAQIPLPTVGSYQEHRHREYFAQRRRLHQTLQKCGTRPKTLDRFAACGSNATVLQHKYHPERVKIGCFKCRHRLCHACQRETAGIIRGNLEALCRSAHHKLSLLTLTLKHTGHRLSASLKRLLTAFRDLRRLIPWKHAVTAGAWVLEIKIGQDNLWHPHIHVLMHNTYLEQGWLSQAWKAVTGDSTNAHIKRITPGKGCQYITKYVSKPIDDTVWSSEDALQEFINATHRQRKCATFGKWRGCKLATPSEDPEVWDTSDSNCPKNWQVLCTVNDLILDLYRNDPMAQQIFHLLFLSKKGPAP